MSGADEHVPLTVGQLGRQGHHTLLCEREVGRHVLALGCFLGQSVAQGSLGNKGCLLDLVTDEHIRIPWQIGTGQTHHYT